MSSAVPTTRERVVDAAVRLTAQIGWSQVTMARLAQEVGVSRQTVYNEVGTKPGLAEAMILRELDRFLASVTVAFDEHPDDPHAEDDEHRCERCVFDAGGVDGGQRHRTVDEGGRCHQLPSGSDSATAGSGASTPTVVSVAWTAGSIRSILLMQRSGRIPAFSAVTR